MRILVIEDEPEVADLLKRTLAEATWAVDVAPTGTAGLQALALTEYDLAVLDLGLSDMDGADVCRHWRQRRGGTPILMLVEGPCRTASPASMPAPTITWSNHSRSLS